VKSHIQLTFRPFQLLSREELEAELGYWQQMMRHGRAQAQIIAARHADRCREFLGDRP